MKTNSKVTPTKARFNKELARAENNVREMDKVDGYKDRYIGTIVAALECGLSADTGGASLAEFDALVMLKDLYKAELDNRLYIRDVGNGQTRIAIKK